MATAHKKFAESDEVEFHTADEVSSSQSDAPQDLADENDSDDDAPEEETISSGVQVLQQRQQALDDIAKREKQTLKEKRRTQAQKLSEQAELKREKQKALQERQLLEQKRQEETQRLREAKLRDKALEDEILMQELARQKEREAKLRQLKLQRKKSEGVRKVEGIRVKVLSKPAKTTRVAQRDTLLNRRKKLLNKR